MKDIFNKVSTLTLLSILLAGCKTDTPTKAVNMEGSWEIYSATRNGKVSKSLKDGIFTFRDDTSFITNIFGENRLYTFDRNGNLFNTKTGDPRLNLRLSASSPDSIMLNTKIKVFDMEFFMVRNDSLKISIEK